MGIFSHFRETGESADSDIVERFGEPKRSLFTSTKMLSLKHKIDITDADDNVIYHSESKVISLHDKTDITDASGSQVAHIEKKVFTLHERHMVEMADGTSFELSNELFHLVKDITNIEGLGWQLRGNIIGLNFELYDKDESLIALTSQKMISLHDKYCIDIYKPEYEKEVVAIVVTLQHIISDREAAAAAAASAGSSSAAASSSS